MFKFIFLLSLFPLYLFSETRTLTFAPLVTKDIEEINTQFLPMIKYLEKKLDVKIQIDYNLDFEKIIKYARETNNKKILDKLFVLAR